MVGGGDFVPSLQPEPMLSAESSGVCCCGRDWPASLAGRQSAPLSDLWGSLSSLVSPSPAALIS